MKEGGLTYVNISKIFISYVENATKIVKKLIYTELGDRQAGVTGFILSS